ncbi:MAG: hypothetical protein H6984_10945 [Pseudomonadales bacterium]|nr:hypothetical protein [Halioglobus sp.]MCP5122974.1 hypothetical protein [Pseudomonadales bacterium]
MAHECSTDGAISEMAIVDTFTKLIFGQEGDFNSSEQLIIQAFRLVDTRVELDTHRDMGHYLRALGVAEMIQLVTRVQACLTDGLHAIARVGKTSVLDRRAH